MLSTVKEADSLQPSTTRFWGPIQSTDRNFYATKKMPVVSAHYIEAQNSCLWKETLVPSLLI